MRLPAVFVWPSVKTALEEAGQTSRKKLQDIELVDDHLILHSPNGTRYYITVTNGGVLGTTAL